MDTEAQVLHHATLRTMRATIAERDARITDLMAAVHALMNAAEWFSCTGDDVKLPAAFEVARAALAKAGAV